MVSVHWNFFIFNVWNNQGTYYGTHPWHWYVSQGLPAVLGTQGLLFVHGVYLAFRPHVGLGAVTKSLLVIFCTTILAYSCLGHKEFRFILHLVPISAVFCGTSLSVMPVKFQRYSIVFLLLTNIPAALYTGLLHQRGTLMIIDKLRASLESRCPEGCQGIALFLTPCHASPLYSHIHENISTKFLTCLPNLDGVKNYADEQSQFYEDPAEWLHENMNVRNRGSPLPHHIIMFDTLYEQLGGRPELSDYSVCATSFHTHFPEDHYGKNIHALCYNGT